MGFGTAIKTTVNGVSKHVTDSTVGKYFKGGAAGLFKGGLYGVGVAASYYTYKDTLGAGGATLYGIGASLPYLGMGILAGEVVHTSLEYGNSVFQRNRQLEFGRPNQDMFGTGHQMRIHSMQSLSRSRSSTQRFMGNEAMHFHNRY